MLSWDSWREIQEGTEKSEVDGDDDSGSGVLSDDVIDDDIEGGKMHESSDVGSGSEDELSGGERIRAEAERRLL